MKIAIPNHTTRFMLAPIVLLFAIHAGAQSQSTPPDFEKVKAAFDACAAQVGLDPNSGPEQGPPSANQKSKMDSCLSSKGVTPPSRQTGARPNFEKIKSALDACASQAGIDPSTLGPDQAPLSSDAKSKIDSCLASKGIKLPPHPPGQGPGPGGEKFREAADSCATEIGVDPSSLGRTPLTDDQRTQMDTCLTNKGFKRPPPPSDNGNFPQPPFQGGGSTK